MSVMGVVWFNLHHQILCWVFYFQEGVNNESIMIKHLSVMMFVLSFTSFLCTKYSEIITLIIK